jgi:hypothetical protein
MSSHPNITVTVNPATGGIASARTPLTIISTLSTIDHVADCRTSPRIAGITVIADITYLLKSFR